MFTRVFSFWFVLFALCFVGVWLGSLLQDIVAYSSTPPNFDSMIWILELDAEMVLFSWLSSLGLFLCSILLLQIASDQPRSSKRAIAYWTALGLIFFYLSADETVSLHERLHGPASNHFDSVGYFHFTWVVIGAPIVAILGLCFVPFLRSLPSKFAGLMILSGALYVGGAIGMEMIGGNLTYSTGNENFVYRLVVHIEEGLEAAGILTFAATLLLYRSDADLAKHEVAKTARQSA